MGETVNTAENRKKVWKKLDSGGKSCLPKNGSKRQGRLLCYLRKSHLMTDMKSIK